MDADAADIPRTLGSYKVLKTIGRGASATVYKACDTTTGEIVAIKAVPDFIGMDPDALERFQREFSSIRGLRHPNLVVSHSLQSNNGSPFIVMEFVPGQNLDERLKSDGPFCIENAVPIFLRAAEGLRYLHEYFILHRDIKPSNIFLDDGLTVKLGDFGLLKDLTNPNQLTRSRRSMGTMEYSAPEQFEDARDVDGRCDLYALAGTLYSALTAKFPFGNGGHFQIMQRKLLKQYVPLRLLLPSLDPAIDSLVDRCLSPKPAERPASCQEFIDVLRESKTSSPTDSFEDDMVKSPSGETLSGPERRTSVRFASDLTTSLVPFHQNMRGRWAATILDISSTGIRLQTLRPIAVNSVLQIALGVATELLLVRWVRAGVGDSQTIGCAFIRPLHQEQIDAIRAPING